MLVAIGRQQLHDLVGPVGRHVTERLRREIDRLAEPKLVCVQRRSPELYSTTPEYFPQSLLYRHNIAVISPNGQKIGPLRGMVAAAASVLGLRQSISLVSGLRLPVEPPL